PRPRFPTSGRTSAPTGGARASPSPRSRPSPARAISPPSARFCPARPISRASPTSSRPSSGPRPGAPWPRTRPRSLPTPRPPSPASSAPWGTSPTRWPPTSAIGATTITSIWRSWHDRHRDRPPRAGRDQGAGGLSAGPLYFVYGAIFVDSEQAHSLHRAIQAVRDEFGYEPSDSLKFADNTRPEGITRADHR